MGIKDIKSRYEQFLFDKPNVVGVMTSYKEVEGERTDLLSLTCLVVNKVPEITLQREEVIPPNIEGVPTDVVEVGELVALGAREIDRRSRLRPCPMGTSGGHYRITAGTNGELLWDKLEGKLCIGTNNHVGANSNQAEIGDAYLQPGPYDGGRNPEDSIGRLLRFVPLSFAGEASSCRYARFWADIFNIPARALGRKTRLKPVLEEGEDNLVDAALIEVKVEDVAAKILDIGAPRGVRTANLDMTVQKSGRTTRYTSDGVVSGIDATVKVGYGGDKVAVFRDQIIVSKDGFSAGGDSGSLILNTEGYAIGKLFAGSTKVTIANHFQTYLDLLDAKLVMEV